MGFWRRVLGVFGRLASMIYIGAACSGGGGGHGVSDSGGSRVATLAPAFGGLAFSNPVKLVQHPTVDDRWYVVEQGGRVRTFLASNPAGSVATALDVVADAGVNLGGGGEQGLLGLAFDPDCDAAMCEIYLAYTDEAANNSVLARWVSSDGGLTFVPDVAPVVLAISHPDSNHNGGDLAFGSDDFLYYSMGDGGGAGDPFRNGQNTMVLLGKILRLDVRSAPPAGESYAIPASNPFAANAHCDGGSGAQPCPEIFAYGLRNPWRMNFDPLTGLLYAGDVGQSAQEEIDVIVLGGNYGWDCLEGTSEFEFVPACTTQTFTPPEVVHGRSDARAITGGVVYRGSAIPGLVGHYVYGDFETGLFFEFDTAISGAPSVRLDLPATPVAAFGQGRDGEIYVVGFGSPSIQKLVPGPG